MGAAIRKRRPDVRKGTIYEGLIATRCADITDSTSGSIVMVRTSHIATWDIRKLKVAFQNYKVVGDSEQAVGSAATVTAAVEYPVNVFSQILFSGQVQGSIPSPGLTICDYAVPAALIPVGATFWIRAFYTNTLLLYTDGSHNEAMNADTTLGDIFNFSSPTPVDRTMGGTIPQENSGKFTLPPAAIIGPTNAPAVVCTGDSIMRGLSEATGIKDQRGGEVCRGFPATTLAFLNHGADGARCSNGNYLSWTPLRRTLWKYASHIIDELGYNDIIYDNVSAATTEANLRKNIWSLYPPNAIIIRTTLTPKSTSSNAFTAVDGSDQTTHANNSVRVTFNTDVRNGLAGVRSFFETGWAVEHAHDDGKWQATGVANGYTGDGDHPRLAPGNTLASSAVDMTQIFYP